MMTIIIALYVKVRWGMGTMQWGASGVGYGPTGNA